MSAQIRICVLVLVSIRLPPLKFSIASLTMDITILENCIASVGHNRSLSKEQTCLFAMLTSCSTLASWNASSPKLDDDTGEKMRFDESVAGTICRSAHFSTAKGRMHLKRETADGEDNFWLNIIKKKGPKSSSLMVGINSSK